MSDQPTHPDASIKLKEKLEDTKLAMMTTRLVGGHLHSRPMYTTEVESTGVLWFFTSDKSGKVKELQHDNHVNLGYTNVEDNLYVSVAGRAELVEDKAKMNDLWNPAMKAWFADGLDTPDIALLKITADHAEYWDTTSSTMVHLYGMAKAALTGESARGDAGKHEELDIR